MPIEIRRIEFTEIELRSALSLYQSKTEGGTGQEGGVSGIKVTGGDEFNIVAKVSCPRDGVVRKVFDHATAIGVMVLFAKQSSIPLPRKGRKILAPTQFGGVAMTVRYEHQVCAAMTPGINAGDVGAKPITDVVGHA